MAIRGILLAAKDGRTRLRREPPESLDSLAEAGRCGHAVVEHVALRVAKTLVLDASPQQIPQKHVLQPPIRQRGAERLAVELRRIA